MFNTQILAGSSGQGGETQQSLKFNDDESQYLSWTPAAAGNRKTWTWSGWVKRGNLGINSFIFGCGSSGTNFAFIGFSSDNTIDIRDYQGSYTYSSKTSQVFRDTSAFYHLVLVADMNNATSADRIKLYVNGERVTSFNSAPSPTTKDLVTNSAIQHVIGSGYYNDGSGVNNYLDGYLSDINFIDGQALDASSFGQFTNGYWEAKDYSGTYGTNGFHLTFQDDVVSEGFNTVTYKGTAATQSISGLGFAPDLVWTKARDITYSNLLVDSVRGVTKELRANGTNAEATNSGVTSFDADGYTLGSYDDYNRSVNTFVAWCWDAGSGSPVSNTDGSITSTVKANPSYGFSIVSYVGNGSTGQSVGTGLSSSDLIIIKNRSATASWHVLTGETTPAISGNTFSLDSGTNRLNLNLTNGYVSYGMDAQTNANGNNYIAYCFNSVAGYSSIGTYSGNGSTSGPTVTTGFRPAFVMVKRTDSTANWAIFDATRSTSNPRSKWLLPNLSNAEGTDPDFEFTDTGFNLVGTGSAWNASGGSYLYVAFADTREAAFWKDVSGQGNHWTPNNLDYRDSLIDSPANNFAVLNPLFTNGGSTQNFKEGNLQFTADGNYALAHGTFAMRTGKWYWETYIKSWVSVPVVGISRGTNTAGNSYVGYDPNGNVKSFGYESGGIIYGASGIGTSAASQLASGQTTYTTGDVIGCSFDADVGELKFYKNGTLIYTVSSIDEFDWMPATSAYNGGINIANFGQDSTFSGARPAGGNTDANGIGDFAYPVPSGYLALCTANLPTPTIVDGSEYFNTVLYTGTGASTLSITGVGFQPDWVWAKKRSATDNHAVADVVRGVTKTLFPNTTGAESTDVNGLQSFDSDGFTIGSGSGSGVWGGNSGDTYVAWNWKAGGTAVSNTDGTITSQVSANVDAGFSVVSWSGNTTSGATVGHGLGVAPDVIIFKRRDGTSDWHTYHSSISNGNTYLAYLNTTAVPASAGAFLNSTYPSSSVITLGNSAGTNGSSMIAYCFANTDTTKAGSYVANQSTDGTFIYLGFRPAFFLAKNISRTQEWIMMNNKTTDPYNPQDGSIQTNSSAAEGTGNEVDFLSNGVKLRNSGGGLNYASGDTFIYLAFAETPFRYANAR